MMGHVVTPDGGRWWMVVAGHWASYGECWLRGEVVPGHTAAASGPTIHHHTQHISTFSWGPPAAPTSGQ